MESQSNWRKRTILFFASQCITLFGSQIVQMAIVWYVTLQTNSGAWVAAFSVCSYLPQFFVSFIGGVWADRYNRKYLIIGADALIAAVTLAMLLIMPYITAEPMLLTALLSCRSFAPLVPAFKIRRSTQSFRSLFPKNILCVITALTQLCSLSYSLVHRLLRLWC